MSQDQTLTNTADEIDAMASMAKVLDKMDRSAVTRVITWLNARYNVAAGHSGSNVRASTEERRRSEEVAISDFPSLFHEADPATEAQKVLVAAYYFQRIQGQTEIDAASVTKELANLGHRISNITMAFNQLMRTKPALAMQVSKSGKSKQARKRYKVTISGLRAVEQMLNSEEQEQ